MKQRKSRRQENVRFMVKWIINNTMYFKAYKRDNAAIAFQDYLINTEGVPPENIRIVMQ